MTKKEPGDPKKQHTVPCGYLAGFGSSPNGRETWLETYNLKTFESKTLRSDYLTIETDFYTLESRDGEPDYRIEYFFRDYVERDIGSVVKKINSHTPLSLKELRYVSEFIAFQEMRSKVRREWDSKQDGNLLKLSLREIYHHLHSDSERKESLRKTYLEQFGMEPSDSELLDIMKKFENNEQITTENKESSIRVILELAPKIANYVLHREWLFIEAPGGDRFVTSDYPVHLQRHPEIPPFYGVGYQTAQYIGFPISKSVFLYAGKLIEHPQTPTYAEVVHSKDIREMNLISTQNAHMWIVGANRKIVDSIGEKIKNIQRK